MYPTGPTLVGPVLRFMHDTAANHRHQRRDALDATLLDRQRIGGEHRQVRIFADLQTAALALVKRQNYGDTLPIAPIAETKIPGRSLPGALAPCEGGNQLKWT